MERSTLLVVNQVDQWYEQKHDQRREADRLGLGLIVSLHLWYAHDDEREEAADEAMDEEGE